MKILTADIGGTNMRFSHFDIENWDTLEQRCTTTFPTKSESITSFASLIQHFSKNKSETFCHIRDYDAVVFAVAGPVIGDKCTPPNIGWNVDISNFSETQSFLINDFVAQAYGCLHQSVSSSFLEIQKGTQVKNGPLAIIGAGTGLGHCALIPITNTNQQGDKFFPVPSEGGHMAFPFSGENELDFSNFLLKKTQRKYCLGDEVVSGSGLSHIHEFLTGEKLSPAQVPPQFSKNPKTLDMFATFYARACRNYCLSVFSTGGLIISGGVAAKNKDIVRTMSFANEFLNSPTHHKILKNMPIHLNTREDIGLIGSALYGFSMTS